MANFCWRNTRNRANNKLTNLELVTHSVNLKKAVEKYGKFGFLN